MKEGVNTAHLTNYLSGIANFTNDHRSAVAYSLIWNVTVRLHFVQDMMLLWNCTEPTMSLFITFVQDMMTT